VPDALPLASAGTDWRDFRAQLVANAAQEQRQQQQPDGAGGPVPAPRGMSLDPGGGVWAHPVPQPEKGCLLLAHPLMFTSTQVYFSQVRDTPVLSSTLFILLVQEGSSSVLSTTGGLFFQVLKYSLWVNLPAL
jgi:hypothetical protein